MNEIKYVLPGLSGVVLRHHIEDIVGVWQGYFKYPYSYFKKENSDFSIDIFELLNDEEFIGIASDKVGNHQSSIRGSFIDSAVSFKKTYYTTPPSVNSKLKQIGQKQHVYYKGYLASGREFQGTWRNGSDKGYWFAVKMK